MKIIADRLRLFMTVLMGMTVTFMTSLDGKIGGALMMMMMCRDGLGDAAGPSNTFMAMSANVDDWFLDGAVGIRSHGSAIASAIAIRVCSRRRLRASGQNCACVAGTGSSRCLSRSGILKRSGHS